MNSQTEKKNLYNLVIDNPNAAQGRIIENAIQSNENTMEVLETVTAARSNNCNNSEKNNSIL